MTANKWDTIYAQQSCEGAHVAEVLGQNKHLLPKHGVALDLACGLGSNAIFLATLGFEVHAWDISAVALDKINDYASSNKLNISTQLRDVESNPPTSVTYDVVVVANFLFRPIIKDICLSLKPSGLLFYQTFTHKKVANVGPSNPDYLLTDNELLKLCEDMHVLIYREEGCQGDTTQGWRNQAMIVAQQKS